MKKLKGIASLLIYIVLCNIIPFWKITEETALRWIIPLILVAVWLAVSTAGKGKKNSVRRLERMRKGCNMVKTAGITAVAEVFVLWWYIAKYSPKGAILVFSIVIPVLIIALTLFVGVAGIAVSSKQIKLTDHIALLLWWWVPIVNIFIVRKFYKTARREFIFESDRVELENARKQNEICKTKYPVLMVHGIFFRDWQYFNYWGRVPASLIQNGAEIYYGNQQSASSIERSASELAERIEEIIRQTGAEKVNIIAHSKGGLDSRYAISCLGMDKYVASLTTINTPHMGCDMVDFLLEKAPSGLVSFLCRKYNGIFTKLGDNKPDFLAGVNDLRASSAKDFNEKVQDSPDVVYRSYMSVMSSFRSAFFVLGISYLLIKKLNGANDGLVYEGSAVHGEHTLITNKRTRGISHGDVIDLMRENIDGYDVREFYVDILRTLKEKGL